MEWPCWKVGSPYDSLTAFSFCGLFALLHRRVLSLVLSLPVLFGVMFKTPSPKLIEVFAYLFPLLLAFIIKSLILWIINNFFAWGKKRINFYGLACECPIFSIVEETINSIVSSLCILGSFAKSRWPYTYGFISGLCSIPSVDISVFFMPVPHCFDYCSTIIYFEIWSMRLPPLFFLLNGFGYSVFCGSTEIPEFFLL